MSLLRHCTAKISRRSPLQLAAGTNGILPGHLASQFTFYGLFGSLLYAILKFGTNRDFIFVALLFFLLDIVLLGHGNPAKFIVHGVYAIFLSGSIFVYAKILEQNNQKLFLANLFSLSGIVAFSFLFAVLVLTLFPNYKFEYSFLEGQTFTGLLIGFGLGLGFHLYHRFKSKISNQ